MTTTLRKRLLPITIGVAMVALLAFLLMRSGIDKDALRAQVDAFAKALHESAEQQGRDVTFTYSDITVEGGFTNRHGVIHQPKFVSKPVYGDPKDTTEVTTTIAEIYPKSVDFSAITLHLPQPIEVSSGETESKKLLTVKADAPLRFDIAQTQENNVPYLDVRHPVATKLELTYLHEKQTQGAEDETPTVVPVYKTLTVTTADGGSIRSHLSDDDRKLGSVDIEIRDILLTPEAASDGEIKIAELTMHTSNRINENNQQNMAVKLNYGPITAAPDILPYAPMSLAVDATYDDISDKEGAAGDASMKLNRFALTTKESSLTAQADFLSRANDMMPEGTANMTLTNFPYVLKELRNHAMLDAKNEALLTAVAEKISGQKIAEITDLSIDINRPQGGAFTVGKSTFEELFALVLSNAMSSPKSKGSDKPAAPTVAPKKGAMMVEDSARG